LLTLLGVMMLANAGSEKNPGNAIGAAVGFMMTPGALFLFFGVRAVRFKKTGKRGLHGAFASGAAFIVVGAAMALSGSGQQPAAPGMTPPDTAAGMMFAVPGVLLILYGFWAQKRIAEGKPALGQMMGPTTGVTVSNSQGSRPTPAMPKGPPIFVSVCNTLLEAEMAITFSNIGGVDGPRLKFAIMPMQQRDGSLEWSGKDSAGKWHNLAKLKEPAWIFIARDTLPLLKQSQFWGRVEKVEDGSQSLPSVFRT
jgi:hypothetical protein